MNKRKFLKIAGSTGVILAAGGGAFVATRVPTDAIKPWQNVGSNYSDPMRRALSYAILAPNPHNRQPWMIDLQGETQSILTCDLDRLLPTTDPFSRQIVIGLGCFLEMFSLAAAHQGYRADIDYFPGGQDDQALDRRAIAHLKLVKTPGLRGDPLFAQALNRHTNRNPYDTEQIIDQGALQRLQLAAHSTVSIGTAEGPRQLEDLRLLTRDAMIAEYRTPEALQESIDLMRIGRREIETNPDGISLGGPFLETLSISGILTRKKLADPASFSYQTGLDMIVEGAMSAMGFVWITTPDNSRLAQIEAGRAYMRVALQATADRLQMQPMSQALQEYTAMQPYYQSIHDTLARRPGETVQMLARLGYAKNINPAPRWPLRTRIKES